MAFAEGEWDLSPLNPRIPNNEVHVWSAILDLAQERILKLQKTLSAEERQRSEDFQIRKYRERFIAGHGIRRAILGKYLGIGPDQVRYHCNPYGKPFLAAGCGRPGFKFSVSHSHGLALFAVSSKREIGIDLEMIRPIPECPEIAMRCFSPRENLMLKAVPAAIKREAFFTCWTRKEAYAKAKGLGFSLPFDQFDVTLTPGKPAELLTCSWDPRETAVWSLNELSPASGFVGALAVEGHGWSLKTRQWTFSL